MSLQWILGRSGSGKTTYCLEQIASMLREDPTGPPIIFLVPEQMTFQMEYALATKFGLEGMIRAQVFSFTRLAWKVLLETGGITRQHLDSVGIQMLLRNIVEEQQEHLKVYKKTAGQSGFLAETAQTISELKRQCLTPQGLHELVVALEDQEQLTRKQAVVDKLHDLHLIYEQLVQKLAGKYIDSEDYLQLLAEKTPQSAYLQQAQVWVDGFHHFCQQELQVLAAIFQTATDVQLSLLLEPSRLTEEYRLRKAPEVYDLFYVTEKTYQQVNQVAQACELAQLHPIILPVGTHDDGQATLPRFNHSDLAQLERGLSLEGAPERERPAQQSERGEEAEGEQRAVEGEQVVEQPAVQLVSAVNRRTEVEGVCQEIIRLAREKDLRFNEMAILLKDTDAYLDLVQLVAKEYELPVFIDHKRVMYFHPLVELIQATLDILRQNYRYEAVFRLVKTELFCPLTKKKEAWREEMDELENHVLAYGIQGGKWLEPWNVYYPLSPDDDGEEQVDLPLQRRLNKLRLSIVGPLSQLQENLSQAETVQEMCSALYNYLLNIEIPEKLEQEQEQAEASASLDKASEHEQVWNGVIDLLDQLVELAGEEELSLEMFAKMLETGLESMRYSLVPPALDQVIVATFGHSRLSDLKALFVLGVNDGVLPGKPALEGLLSEEDCQVLHTQGQEFFRRSEELQAEETLHIYTSLSAAANYLWVSCSLQDEEGKALLPAYLLKNIQELVPTAQLKLLNAEPEATTEVEEWRYLAHPASALRQLNGQLAQYQRGYPLAPLWVDVYNWLMAESSWQEQTKQSLQGLFYQNSEQPLQQTTARKLYGERLKASVSRMERHSACPFSQFVSYGLRLRERAVFRLEAPDIGQLFHACLQKITENLWQTGESWSSLEQADCWRLAHEAVERVAPKVQRKILLSSQRYLYLQKKLAEVVAKATYILSKQARQSGFAPIGVEVLFGGDNAPLPSLQFTLPNGVIMELVGRIDRVDLAEAAHGVFLRVIDYKSSERSLSLSEVYYGLALQMLAYLDVLISNAQEWIGQEAQAAGVLYFHIHHPYITAQQLLAEDEVEKEVYKKFKMKGLLLADSEVVQIMDTRLESQWSEILPVALTNTGQFYKNSAVASREELTAIRQFVRQRMVQIGTAITEGEISIAPYKLKKKSPCQYCSYRSICQFDLLLAENDYRILPEEKREVLLAKMLKEGGEGDE